MTAVVNGRDLDVADMASIADLVRHVLEGVPPTGVAVALNGEVVPRSAWDSTRVVDGDRVEVLTAVGGG